MSTTLNRKGGAFPWLMLTGMLFCQALYKGIEGEDWKEMYDSHKVMSGCKEAAEAQKAKALGAMKAAKDRKGKSFMIRLAKLTFCEEITRD